MGKVQKLLVAILLCAATSAHADLVKVWGWAEQGGQRVAVGPYLTKQAQRSYPGATITVYDAGTLNLSTLIYTASDGLTQKANPFTADSTGYWWFYSDDAQYDIQISGSGFSTYTLSDVYVVTSVSAGVCANCVTTNTVQTITSSGIKTFQSSNVASHTFTASAAANTTPSLIVQEHASGQSGIGLFDIRNSAAASLFSVAGTTGLVTTKSVAATGSVTVTTVDGVGNSVLLNSADTNDPTLYARSSADSAAKFQATDSTNTDPTVVIQEETPTGQAASTKMLDVRNQATTSVASIDAEGDIRGKSGTFINGSDSGGAIYALTDFLNTPAIAATATSGASIVANAAANTNTAPTVLISENSSGQAANTNLLEVRDQSAAAVATIDAEGDVTVTSITAATGVVGGGAATAGKELDVNGDFEATTGNITGVLTVGSCVGCSTAVLPAPDTTSIIEGSADNTKEVRFEVDGLTTATTRVITVPDANFTMAGRDVAQTFSAVQTFSTAAESVAVSSSSVTDYALDVDGASNGVRAVITGTSVGNAGVFSNNSNNAGSTIGVYGQSAYGSAVYGSSGLNATEAAAIIRHNNSTANTRVLELQNHLGTAVAYIDREGDATLNNLTVTGTIAGVVQTTGAQSIAGVKTFSNQIIGTYNSVGDGAVKGTSTAGYGVEGTSTNSSGVYGYSNSAGTGVTGVSNSGAGISGTSTSDSSGVFQAANAANVAATVEIIDRAQAAGTEMLRVESNAGALLFSVDNAGATVGQAADFTAATVDTLLIGTGSALSRAQVASEVYDMASLANATAVQEAVTVSGASVGDPCFAGYSTLTSAAILVSCNVTAVNTATVTFYNVSGGAVDPASGTLRVTVIE